MTVDGKWIIRRNPKKKNCKSKMAYQVNCKNKDETKGCCDRQKPDYLNLIPGFYLPPNNHSYIFSRLFEDFGAVLGVFGVSNGLSVVKSKITGSSVSNGSSKSINLKIHDDEKGNKKKHLRTTLYIIHHPSPLTRYVRFRRRERLVNAVKDVV